jgi:hypothetical protein
MRHTITGTLTRTLLACGIAAGISVFAATASSAQQGTKPTYKRDVPARLAREAKIPEDSAVAVARAKVPNGTVSSLELEREDGHLMYSMDVKVPGKSGIEEVNVNAVDGSLIAVEHESAATEAKEAKTEAAEKKAKHKQTPADASSKP